MECLKPLVSDNPLVCDVMVNLLLSYRLFYPAQLTLSARRGEFIELAKMFFTSIVLHPPRLNLPLIFRVYISCQSGFCNDLHLPWFLESGQKLGRFERDKLDFPSGVTCEEPVMPSGARQAAALLSAVAAFCMFLSGRC